MDSSWYQIWELESNCTCVWTTQNVVVFGRKFTGPNGGTIFLHAADYSWDGGLSFFGSKGYYWSSTPYDDIDTYLLGFSSNDAYWAPGATASTDDPCALCA